MNNDKPASLSLQVIYFFLLLIAISVWGVITNRHIQRIEQKVEQCK